MFADITDEEAKDMQEVAAAITLQGAFPHPHPDWMVSWLMATEVNQDKHPLMVSQVLPSRILLSLLLRSQKQDAELAAAKKKIADLMDPDMPGDDLAADLDHLVDHSNEGWMQVDALRRKVHTNSDQAHEVKNRERSVLVLDDDKYLDYILKKEGLYQPESESGPERYKSVSLARNIRDAVALVKRNPRFDLWVLDQYLRGEEGGELLERIAEECPEKLPKEVMSCSSMHTYELQVQKLFSKAKEKSCQI